MNLADNIHNERIRKGIAPLDIAKLSHISYELYLNIEDDKDYPTYTALQRIAAVLDVSLPTLLFCRHHETKLTHVHLSNEDYIFQWVYFWLAHKENTVSYNQFASLQSLSNHLLRSLGSKKLRKLKVFDCNDVFDDLFKKYNLSHKTIKGVRSCLKQIYQLAIDLRVCDYNPVLSSRIPKMAAKSEETKVIDNQTILAILKNTSMNSMQLAVMIMLLAGLRRGELLALQYKDINLKEGYITIDKAIEYCKGVPNLKPPKTRAGKRYVDMPDLLISHIVKFYQANPKINPDDLIIQNTLGSYCNEKRWNKYWNDYLTELQEQSEFKLEYFTSKQLRHSCCTLLYNAGVDAKTTKEFMGHTDIKTTLDFYTHLERAQTRKSMIKVNKYLRENYDL